MGSVEPPGGYGTMNFTGLVGQACACTASAPSASATAAAARTAKRIIFSSYPLTEAGYHCQDEDRNDGLGGRGRIHRRGAGGPRPPPATRCSRRAPPPPAPPPPPP